MSRPSIVVCAACHQEYPARRARERITVWARSASGEGTLTHPAGLARSNQWTCDTCWRENARPDDIAECLACHQRFRNAADFLGHMQTAHRELNRVFREESLL